MNMASLEGLLGEEACPAVVESAGAAWGKAVGAARGKGRGATEIA